MPSITGAKDAFFSNIVTGFANAIRGAFDSSINVGSWFGEVKEAMGYVRDSQEDLNNRTDLLSPLLDYCSVYARLDDRGHARFGVGKMPFTEQIGPSRNVAVAGVDSPFKGDLTLKDKGLWNIDAHVMPSWTGLGNDNNLKVTVRVRNPLPDGSVFSEQTAVEKTNNVTTINISSSVMVPGPGYTVQVYVEQCGSSRGVYGGPKWSRLTVQHISRSVEQNSGGESSTPDPTSNGPE